MQTITIEQEFDLKIAFVTGAGQPATVTGISWTNSADAVVSVTPSVDGLSAVVSSTGLGTSTITVSGSTPSGGTVTGTFDVTVTEAEAAGVEFTVENIRLKVVPPPAP